MAFKDIDQRLIDECTKDTVDLDKIKKLIAEGVAQEWMVCDNPARAARHIGFALDGMRVASQTFGLTEIEINQEIEYILGTLGLVVE